MPSTAALRLGRQGEAAAVAELQRLGYRVRCRNFRCRGGEADVVAEEGGDLVFVEVKTRSGLRYGLPQDAVGWRKQQRLAAAALRYLHDMGAEEPPVRFDVVEVVLLRGEVATIEIVRDAFVPDV